MTKNRKIIALENDSPFFSRFATGHILEIDDEGTLLHGWKDAVIAKNLTEPQRTETFPAVLFFDEFDFLDENTNKNDTEDL